MSKNNISYSHKREYNKLYNKKKYRTDEEYRLKQLKYRKINRLKSLNEIELEKYYIKVTCKNIYNAIYNYFLEYRINNIIKQLLKLRYDCTVREYLYMLFKDNNIRYFYYLFID